MPEVWPVFWSFRIMVGFGLLMLAYFVLAVIYTLFNQVEHKRMFFGRRSGRYQCRSSRARWAGSWRRAGGNPGRSTKSCRRGCRRPLTASRTWRSL